MTSMLFVSLAQRARLSGQSRSNRTVQPQALLPVHTGGMTDHGAENGASALLAQVTQASGTTQGPHGDRGVPSVRSVTVVGSRTCDVLPGRALRLAAAGRARDHRSIGDGLRGRAGSSAAVRHDGTRARRSISAIRPVGVPPKWSPPEVRGGDWLPPGSSSRSFRRGPAVAIVVRSVHGRTACRGHQSQHDHHGGHRGQPILSRCPRAQSRPVWPPSSGATTPPRPPSTGGSPPPTSTTSIARIDGHEQARAQPASKLSDTEFMQYRSPVGVCGASGKTCPRWEPQRLQRTSTRRMNIELSSSSSTASDSEGA